jgi:hypothetical protein
VSNFGHGEVGLRLTPSALVIPRSAAPRNLFFADCEVQQILRSASEWQGFGWGKKNVAKMQPDFSPQQFQSVILSEVEIARSALSTQSKDPYNLHSTAAITELYARWKKIPRTDGATNP